VPFRSRPRAVLLAGVALTAALVAGCTSVVSGSGTTGTGAASPAPVTPNPTGSSVPSDGGGLRFGGCSGIDLGSSPAPSDFDVQCARLSVPLDYADPSGKQISVALVRLHRKDSSASTPLLMDPGGPGGSGVQFGVEIAAALPQTVTDKYDVVGFDPRGVGSSTPVRCLSDAQKDELNAASPDVRTAAGRAQAKQEAQQVAQADATLIQVASPSRERVEQYRLLREEVEGTVGHINGTYDTLENTAVRYLHHSYPVEEMVALYLAADVMLVTALRDGMNLVAKEYVTARNNNDGALVLSEFAGAADQLKQALLINPHDIAGLKNTIMAAVELTPREASRRMRAMRKQILDHDVDHWSADFLRALNEKVVRDDS